jgi:hypothetical protein
LSVEDSDAEMAAAQQVNRADNRQYCHAAKCLGVPGCNFISGAVAAQELLDKGKADTKEIGNRLLHAKLALKDVQDFLR